MGVTGHVPLPNQVRRRFWRLIAAGFSTEDAAVAVGVIGSTGRRWFVEAGGVTPVQLAEPRGRYLSFSEREEIAVDRVTCLGVREIARRLGRAPRQSAGSSPAAA